MKTYKIIPDTAFFIGAIISLLLGLASVYIPKEVVEPSLGKASAVIIFLVVTILLFLLSVIFGKIREVEEKK